MLAAALLTIPFLHWEVSQDLAAWNSCVVPWSNSDRLIAGRDPDLAVLSHRYNIADQRRLNESSKDSTVLVRTARPDDDMAIWRIMEPIIRAAETYPLASDMSEADAIAYWKGPEDETFVVEDGDEIVGTYHLRPNYAGGGAHIANVGYMTSPEAAGRGVGRRMVEHSLQQARDRGFKAIQFNFVVSTNETAVRLYERFGFSTIGTVPLGFLHPSRGYVDVLVMFKPL